MEIESAGTVEKVDSRPWVEKYRPKDIGGVVFQDEAVSAFKGISATKKLPHLILYGPPGTGKTSLVLALAKELFGADDYKERILELNASDDRGIARVRDKIKKYAETKIQKLPGRPAYKLIILDEADQMTVDAQNALRRIIEDFSALTRFCIICNYITKIIEPLKSRCVKFRFREIPVAQQLAQLANIAQSENAPIEEEALRAITEVSGGDLRRSVNLLQMCASCYKGRPIGRKEVYDVSDVLPFDNVEASVIHPFRELAPSQRIAWLSDNLLRKGVTCQQLISALHKWIIEVHINESKATKIVELLSNTEKNIILGGKDDLNILMLLETFCSFL